MNRIAIFVMLFVLQVSAYAQVIDRNCDQMWNEIVSNGYYLSLQSYGLYQNGKEVNRFQPSKKTNNEDECMWLTDDYLCWASSVEGNLMFDYKIEGPYLYYSNKRVLDKKDRVAQRFPDYSSWIKIEYCELVSGTAIIKYIFTTSKEGTYRYLHPVKLDE